MKRMVFVCVVVLMGSGLLWAAQQWGGQMPGIQPQMPYGAMPPGTMPPGVMPPGAMPPGMDNAMDTGMNQIMMQRMELHRSMLSNQGMALLELMNMMKGMVSMQKRVLADVPEGEKKKLAQELSRISERLDKMIAGMKGMMLKNDAGMPAETKPVPKKENKKGEGNSEKNIRDKGKDKP